VIASDETLKALAARRPSTTSELAAIPGLGPAKIARYGEAILAVVADRTADTT
jgi:superfamily II DNA helicase RecQ